MKNQRRQINISYLIDNSLTKIHLIYPSISLHFEKLYFTALL